MKMSFSEIKWDEFPFHNNIGDKLPALNGVYCITSGNNILYIGSSQSIRNRVSASHHAILKIINDGHEELVIKYFVCEYYKSIERCLIIEKKPRYNKQPRIVKMSKTMINPTPEYIALNKRRKEAFDKLYDVAMEKTRNSKSTLIYTRIGYELGLTAQSVSNYVKGKCKNGNGYVIEALITEFNKLPTPSK